MYGKNNILWFVNIIFDVHLHKTAQIGIWEHLALSGNRITVVGLRSKKNFEIDIPNLKLYLIPLRYFPALSSIAFSFLAFILFPFYVLIKKPNFVFIEPKGILFINFIWKLLLFPLHFKIILEIRSTPVAIVNILGKLELLLFNLSISVSRKVFDGITIVTEMMKNEICEKFSVNKDFVGVWTNGVSLKIFDPQKYDELKIRKKLGLIDKFVVFYHGEINVFRGLIESVESINLLKNKFDDLVLFLLGDGPDLSQIKKIVNQKELLEKVVIHDKVDYLDVPMYIAMCHVGLLPLPNIEDWRNQCALKLLEYLAMQKMVIVTDIPANREVIKDSAHGMYVHASRNMPINPEDIADRIEYAYINRNRLKEWGYEGRKIVEERYSWYKVVKDLEDYLQKVQSTKIKSIQQ